MMSGEGRERGGRGRSERERDRLTRRQTLLCFKGISGITRDVHLHQGFFPLE